MQTRVYVYMCINHQSTKYVLYIESMHVYTYAESMYVCICMFIVSASKG